MGAQRIDGIRAGIDTPCAAYDDLDITCKECVLHSMEQHNSCFKTAERAVRASENKCSIRCRGNETGYCEAVQKVLEVLCGACEKKDCGKGNAE